MVLLLRDLQSSANRQYSHNGNKVLSPLTWDAINNQLQSSGNPEISYDEFNARWGTDPILKQLVDRFDGQGLVIKTKGSMDQPDQGAPKPQAMAKMAKRATDKAFK